MSSKYLGLTEARKTSLPDMLLSEGELELRLAWSSTLAGNKRAVLLTRGTLLAEAVVMEVLLAVFFLEDFVPEAQPWLHVDLFAWTDGARPGRPVGGEAQTIRTMLAFLERRWESASQTSQRRLR